MLEFGLDLVLIKNKFFICRYCNPGGIIGENRSGDDFSASLIL